MKTTKSVLVPVAFLAGLAATIVVQRWFGWYPLTTGDAPYGILSLEFAGTAERARGIVDSWRANGLLGNVGPNMRVDDLAFIPSYVVTLVFGCRWASNVFEKYAARVARWIAFGQIAAGVLDLIENRAMLFTVAALEAQARPAIAPLLATTCAALKFTLVGIGIATILAGLIARLPRRPPTVTREHSEASPFAPGTPFKECDLVMKGGITSGVIYPKAVLALANEYRFRNIGGTSAGAIAAAVTAAAEYGRDAPGGGFAKLSDMVEQLKEQGFLYNLFQPSAEAWPLLAGLLSYRRRRGPVGAKQARSNRDSLLEALPRVLWTMFASSTASPLFQSALLGTIAGLLVAALLMTAALVAAHPLAAAILLVFALLAILLGWLIGMGLGVQQLLTRHIPHENFYGLCTGKSVHGHERRSPVRVRSARTSPALTNWLTDIIDELAGLPLKPVEGQLDPLYPLVSPQGEPIRIPLTFRHLALNHRDKVTIEHKIELNMVTTNISQGVPYTLPFTSGPFLFSEQEFRKLFPDPVVDYMIAVSLANPPADVARQPIRVRVAPGEDRSHTSTANKTKWNNLFRVRVAPGEDRSHTSTANKTKWNDLYFLPRGLDLPVVVGARMSLSFPVLISAVPLWTIQADRLTRQSAGAKTLSLEPGDLQRNWFSDGGACSNFPIHFYDRWFPGRPTFGINLETLPEGFIPDDDPQSLLREDIAKYRSFIRPERWPEAQSQPLSPVLKQQLPRNDSWNVREHLDTLAFSRELAQMPAAGSADSAPLPWQSMNGNLATFLFSIVNTGLFYRDTALARLPSYYDRVVTLYLSEQEGGLNLDMPTKVIEKIAKRGGQAGDKIHQFSFDRHRWVRLRLLLAEMETQLGRLRASLLPSPETPENGGDICPMHPAGEPRLDWNNPDVQAALATLQAALERAGFNENIVRQLLLCQQAHPGAFPYSPSDDWSTSGELSARFALLQLMIEMWTQPKQGAAAGDSFPAFFRDPDAPPRDGMSMRVTPDL